MCCGLPTAEGDWYSTWPETSEGLFETPFRIALLGLGWRAAYLLAVHLHRSRAGPVHRALHFGPIPVWVLSGCPQALPHALASGSLRQEARGTWCGGQERGRGGGVSCRAHLSQMEAAVTRMRVVDRQIGLVLRRYPTAWKLEVPGPGRYRQPWRSPPRLCTARGLWREAVAPSVSLAGEELLLSSDCTTLPLSHGIMIAHLFWHPPGCQLHDRKGSHLD